MVATKQIQQIHAQFAKILVFTALLGGGDAFVIIAILALPLMPSNLNAVELSDACKFYPANKRCEITAPYQSVENNKQYDFSLFIDRVEVSNFINYGSLSSVSTEYGGSIKNFYNYGTITNELTPNASNNIHIENYGTMGDIVFDLIQQASILNIGTIGAIRQNGYTSANVTLDYRSICKANCSVNTAKVVLKTMGYN